MKIEKQSHLKSKLIQLNLIKTKSYKNNVKLKQIELSLKKMLKLIYSYTINNKRILFVSNFMFNNKKINFFIRNTNHLILPENVIKKNLLNNKNWCFNKFLKKLKTKELKTTKLTLQLKKNIDLLVILSNNNEINLLKESYIKKIISVSNTTNKLASYKIFGSFLFSTKVLKNNFFCSILYATLIKSNDVKKKK